MKKLDNPFVVIAVVYIVCYAIRLLELLILRTDQGIFGEAFLQKVTGIVILVLVARHAGYHLKDIGFAKTKAFQGTLLGLGLGLAVFGLAYGAEYFLLLAQGQTPSFDFFVSAYALDGNVAGTTTLVTVGLCVVFNIINVAMEEGIFRGLFTKLAQKRSS